MQAANILKGKTVKKSIWNYYKIKSLNWGAARVVVIKKFKKMKQVNSKVYYMRTKQSIKSRFFVIHINIWYIISALCTCFGFLWRLIKENLILLSEFPFHVYKTYIILFFLFSLQATFISEHSTETFSQQRLYNGWRTTRKSYFYNRFSRDVYQAELFYVSFHFCF